MHIDNNTGKYYIQIKYWKKSHLYEIYIFKEKRDYEKKDKCCDFDMTLYIISEIKREWKQEKHHFIINKKNIQINKTTKA